MPNRDPRLPRLLQAATLLRDHATGRLSAAQAARADLLARLAQFDPAPLDSAEAELHRAAQRHAVWAERHRQGLLQNLARQEAALRDLQQAAARAQARCQVLEKRIVPPRGQSS